MRLAEPTLRACLVSVLCLMAYLFVWLVALSSIWLGFADGCRVQMQLAGQWFIFKDINCDGLFTITDVALGLKWLFFLPGEAFFQWLLHMERLAVFLEVAPDISSGWIPILFSVVTWLVFLILTGLADDLFRSY